MADGDVVVFPFKQFLVAALTPAIPMTLRDKPSGEARTIPVLLLTPAHEHASGRDHIGAVAIDGMPSLGPQG